MRDRKISRIGPRNSYSRPLSGSDMGGCCLCGARDTLVDLCDRCGRMLCGACRLLYVRPDGHCSIPCRYREHPWSHVLGRLSRAPDRGPGLR